ncbi:RHS Repeat protein, partial [Fusarium austroafricanum]
MAGSNSESAGQYQGSQAFAHIVPGQNESINPNTGSLNFTKPLIQLRGISDSANFDLCLLYNEGSSGAFGLPSNWSLNLPYVLPGKSITFSGRTYALDSMWTDSKSHQSGIRYLNNHGIEFSPIIPPESFSVNQPAESAYRLKLQDGSMDFFDALGRPIAHQDIFKNTVYYFYLEGPSDGAVSPDPCLDYILDSWGQKIEFSYQPGFEIDGVSLVIDPLGYETRFTYSAIVANHVTINKIIYPTGLMSEFVYGATEYLDGYNTSQYLPVVCDHYQKDESGKILKHANYHFGPSGGLTFTGITIGCQLSGLNDDLMDGHHIHYKYDVLTTHRDPDGKVITATLNWYNYLHLPIEEHNYLVDGQGVLFDAYKTEFRYVIDQDAHVRTTNYSQPREVEHFHNIETGGEPGWRGLRKSAMDYDAFGELTSQVDEIPNTAGAYTATKTITRQYFTTDLRIQKLKAEVVTDMADGSIREVENILSADQRSILASTIYAKTTSDNTRKPWKKYMQRYDDQGRVIEDTLAWADGAIVPDGSAASYTTSTQFSYSQGILIETKSDSSRGPKKIQYDVRISGGPIICTTLPSGQIELSEYDRLGRIVKHTDALGFVSTQSYSISPGLITETSTLPNGHIKLITFDALGRPISETDNADPTQLSRGISRVTKRTSYDTMGRPVSTSDISGLVTTNSFDALGRSVRTIDPAGNVISTMYDDAQLKAKQTLNGDVRKESFLDACGRVVRQTVFPDSNSPNPFTLIQETSYNGGGQKIKEAISQQCPDGNRSVIKLLRSEVWNFDADGRIASQSLLGMGDRGEDTVTREFVYDLLGNTHTWTKEAQYSDGRKFKHQGSVSLFDMHGNLVLLRNQLGQEEHNIYDQNGWLTATTRFDGSTISFTRDAEGKVVQSNSSTGVTELTYNPKGQISTSRFKHSIVKFDYFLDGSVRSVDYGDGRVQRYERDKFSRVIQETDVFGNSKSTSYDSLGRTESIVSQDDTIKFHYGAVNHNIGTLVGYSVSGKLPYTVRLNYDGFQHRSKVTHVAHDETVLLETTYTINAHGHLASLHSISAYRQDLNRNRTWLYDGLGQLVEDKVTDVAERTQQFLYDGNSNIVSLITNGQIKTMAYNAIDQRIDPGFEYDRNGRLVRDDMGRSYVFDDADHLLAVEAEGVKSLFSYHGDDSLATILQPQDETGFFYTRDKNINAISHRGADNALLESSVLRENESVFATYSTSLPPTYFFEQHGSTAMEISGNDSLTITYDAYGSQTSSAALKQENSFTFGQELVEPTSGLLYLRSRFYQPDNMAFISMDSLHLENRYAYCQGDPVNYFDPSGHLCLDWKGAIGAVAGGAAAAVASFVTMGLAMPAVPLCTSAIWSTVASVGASMAISALSNVAGSLVTNTVTSILGAGWSYSWMGFLQDILAGFAGVFTAGVGGIILKNSERLRSVVSIGVDLLAQRLVVGELSGESMFDGNALAYIATSITVGLLISREAAKRIKDRRIMST